MNFLPNNIFKRFGAENLIRVGNPTNKLIKQVSNGDGGYVVEKNQ